MGRRRGWIIGLAVAGVVLTLPQVALWRPTPDTPLAQGLYWVAGLSYQLSALLLGVSIAATAVLVGERMGVVRLPGRPSPRLLLAGVVGVVGGTLVQWMMQGVLLGAEGQMSVRWPLLLLEATSWVVMLGYALLGVWLVARLSVGDRDEVPGGQVRDRSQLR
ncbi:hypothetical protein SGUI_0397 [Serinicoccus hydrothermalis]|uniref:Uncharacterized protein n=1 Tax=Serinicoccus hydrothermalis TaxID=1758689 RepID=A0A1B1N8N3_9MICO|nr:hypothetical protein [Serinicoccus hydrothermalis]ANS77793.1 hypothetical protein SGUI_0397 [Serinicoccus hydrothermalis]